MTSTPFDTVPACAAEVAGKTAGAPGPGRPSNAQAQPARPLRRHAALASRIIAALFGGYLLAALSAIAPLALPVAPTEAVLAGMMLSFLVYAGAVIWVFACATATRAWLGLLTAALPLAAACWYTVRQLT